jgi:hypothetical protein
MIKTAFANLFYWRRAFRARLALVLMMSLVIAGLQSHITFEHAVAPDPQAFEFADDHGHSHDEPEDQIQHSGHDHSQDAMDHSHQFSLIADHINVFEPVFADVAHLTPQQSSDGIKVFDIDKPPRHVAII